jgi:hypothetical protein
LPVIPYNDLIFTKLFDYLYKLRSLVEKEQMLRRVPAKIILFLVISFQSIYPMDRSGLSCPDGTIGRLSGWFLGSYTSVTGRPNTYLVDRENYFSGIVYPLSERFTAEATYGVERADSIFHIFSIATKIRLGRPVRESRSCNPDGTVGLPLVSFSLGERFYFSGNNLHFFRSSFAALYPVSSMITIGAGYNYYGESNPRLVDKLRIILDYFPRRYPQGQEYDNPDGPEGTLSFSMTMGGAANGFFGQLGLNAPLNREITIAFMLRGEVVNSPSVRSLIPAVKINYYPADR